VDVLVIGSTSVIQMVLWLSGKNSVIEVAVWVKS